MNKESGTYPSIVIVKKTRSDGYTFSFGSKQDFDNAIESFLNPISALLKARHKEGILSKRKLQLISSLNFLKDVLWDKIEEEFDYMTVKLAASAFISATPWKDNKIPQIVVIETKDDEVVVKDNYELVEQQGYPKVIVIGTPKEGGGIAQFFDSKEEFINAAQQTVTEKLWLPQIINSAYDKITSIVFARPLQDEKTGKVKLLIKPYNLDETFEVQEKNIATNVDYDLVK